jgi:hypothetical protein
MKKWILFLLIFSTSCVVQAQSLKDMLYSGKLKKDSNIVIRKGDDLSVRIDTGSTKEPETVIIPNTTIPADSVKKAIQQSNATLVSPVVDASTGTAPAAEINTDAVATVAPAKSNNQLWKTYMDSLVASFKPDVLESKKVKKNTYFMFVEYEIGTEGQVNVLNVTSSPENSFLQDGIKERLNLSAPQLAPLMDSAGKPRKVKRKYNFSITKD